MREKDCVMNSPDYLTSQRQMPDALLSPDDDDYQAATVVVYSLLLLLCLVY